MGHGRKLMDLWNRLFIIAVALFIIAGVIIILLVTTGAIAPSFLPGGTEASPTGAWFYSELKGLQDSGGSSKAVTLVLTSLVGLAMVGLIGLELRPAISPRPLIVSNKPEGMLTMEQESVQLLAERTGISNRQVSSLRCVVRRQGKSTIPLAGGLIITCYPRLVLGSNVQDVRDDLQTRIKESVEGLIGLQVLRVNVARVKYDHGNNSRLLGLGD